MKAIRPEELHLAVDRLYAAIVTGDDGGEALDTLAKTINAASCFFFPKDGATLLERLPQPEAVRPFLSAFVRDGWHLRDHRTQRGWPLADAGLKVVLEHDLVSDDERKRLPICQELLREHDLPWFAAVAFQVDGRDWCLSIPRHAEQGAFSREDAKVLALLAPRLAPLIALAEKFGDARASGAMDALTHAGTPALLVDVAGRCRRANPHAERLFDRDFHPSHGRLRAEDRESDARLQNLLDAVCAPSRGYPSTAPLTAVVIARPGRRPLLVEALPVRAGFADVFSGGTALLTIIDLAEYRPPSEKLLTQMFGLTPAEARLAACLAGGATLDSAADTLAITRETARTRLKAVRSKTGTGRQAELAALLERLARRSTEHKE